MENQGYLAISESARHTSELRLTTNIQYRWQFYCPTNWAISNLYRYFYSKYCEIRFKLISQLAAKYQPGVIIELASGLSPRGLIMSEARNDLLYFDSDLPAIIEYKKLVCQKNQLALPLNLFFAVKDLQQEEIDFPVQSQTKHIIIISEGLLPWLNQDQAVEIYQKIKRFAQNFLQTRLTWITDLNLVFHDLDNTETMINQQIKNERRLLGEKIKQPVVSQPFADLEAFKRKLYLDQAVTRYGTQDLIDPISSIHINQDLITDIKMKTAIDQLVDKKVVIVEVKIN